MEHTEILKNLIRYKFGTQEKFCEEADIKTSTLSTIFTRGIYVTKLDIIAKICKTLEISLDRLLNLNTDFLDLSEQEKEMLEKFRELPDKDKWYIMGVIDTKLSEKQSFPMPSKAK